LLQEFADALLRVVEMREVVRHDQGVVGPCVVVGQHRAVSIREDDLKFANPAIGFRAALLPTLAFILLRDLVMLRSLRWRFVGKFSRRWCLQTRVNALTKGPVDERRVVVTRKRSA
jgi:hypothetical protein